MRRLVIILMLFTACSQKPEIANYPVTALGSISGQFTQGESMEFAGARVVDSSIISVNGKMKTFFDYNDGRSFGSSTLDIAGSESEVETQVTDLNFTYVIVKAGVFYRFGERNWDIYLDKSTDGIAWHRGNNNRPVVSHSPDLNSDWHFLWNVAVDVDENGVFHMLIECSNSTPNQGAVGLCYATGTAEHFTRVSEAQIIQNAGNPYLKLIPGKGMLVVHGILNEAYGPFSKSFWYVGATTCDENGLNCERHNDRFVLGTPGIHDADPHVAELPGGSLIVVLSIDQSHCTRLTAPNLTLEQFYNQLTE